MNRSLSAVLLASLLAACSEPTTEPDDPGGAAPPAQSQGGGSDAGAGADLVQDDGPVADADTPDQADFDDSPREVVGGDAVEALRVHINDLEASPERERIEKVEVQHLLISFSGAGTNATRSREEAEALVADLWAQIQTGDADFDAIVREHTDDSHPGIYTMTASSPGPGEYQRSRMVPAFGNVGWRLEVGEYGVAGHDPQTSPYGWHIVKCLSSEAAPEPTPEMEALREHVTELMARPEKQGVTDVTVQHLLISFAGAGTSARRTKFEAEQLAAEIWAQIQAGDADFDALVEEHTDDSPPGIYSMTSGASRPGAYPRTQMVAAFGDVGWRLDVGEFGVAGFDPRKSQYGWHIIKRIE